MTKKYIFDLTGGEVLAKPVMNASYQIILAEGSVLQKDYIQTIADLGILEVYIKDSLDEDIMEMELLRSEVKEGVTQKVKSVLSRYIYQQPNSELIQLAETADRIIESIMSDENVAEKIFDIKERSTDLYEHSINVCSMAILIALKMELDEEKVHEIGIGSLLHDLGLRQVTTDYVNNVVSEMSEELQAEYKKHPIYGYEALKDEQWLSANAKNIVLSHHETIDGLGFPLRMTDFPIECQIVGICDVFDEMICGIATNKVKVYEALEYLKYFQNTRYNAKIVEVFLSFTAVYPVGTYVKLNTGEIGTVLSQNSGYQNRPVLRIILDAEGNELTEEKHIDMLKVRNVFIDDVVDPIF